MRIIEDVDRIIEGRRLLDHPFYQAWSRGELSWLTLARYAEQYYHWVSAFPTFLSAAHSRCRDIEVRQAILENLMDEEHGPDNHPELWLRFCDALGLDRRDVQATACLPETEEAISVVSRLCHHAPTSAALAALYAYESQQPQVMAEKRRGLIEHYWVTTGHNYFIVRKTLDIEHSASQRALIERLATDEDRHMILTATRASVDATYTLLHGVFDACGQVPCGTA
jgi:pyrroloquinoline-quinone synthase